LNFSIDSNIICGKYTVKIYISPILLPFRYIVGEREDKERGKERKKEKDCSKKFPTEKLNNGRY